MIMAEMTISMVTKIGNTYLWDYMQDRRTNPAVNLPSCRQFTQKKPLPGEGLKGAQLADYNESLWLWLSDTCWQ